MNDNEISGFVLPGHIDISQDFTELTPLESEGYSLLVKAKRYGRWWMLKGLKDEYRSQSMYRVLLRKEFELLVNLQHPGVVAVSDFMEVESLGPCIVMEWIDGVTLTEWLSRPHNRADRRQVVAQLLDALEYVHGKQVVHRDLKPSNIMVTRSGQHVKLIDFGLSDADDYAILKQPAGTADYLSPEQREQWQTDVRNDIYSLGCVLDDMKLGPLYTPVVRRCLGAADKRYGSVDEVRRALRRCARLPRLLLFGLLALLLIGAVYGLYRYQRFVTNTISDIEDYNAFQENRESHPQYVYQHGLAFDCIDDSTATIGTQRAPVLPKNLIIPDSVTYKGRQIPVRRIRWHAFWGCQKSVSSVYIPRTVSIIEDGAFDGAFSIHIGSYDVDPANPAFCSRDGVLYTKDMHELVKYPGGQGRTTFALPPSIQIVRGSSFDSARYLERVTLGDSVRIIGAYAFANCVGLSVLNIPAGMRAIGENAFPNCPKLDVAFTTNPMRYRGKSSLDTPDEKAE